jgi:hypothetical protein
MGTSVPISADDADIQARSRLFQLPAELRLSIYEYLSQTPLHVVGGSDGRHRFVLCVADHEAPDSRQVPPSDPDGPKPPLQDATWSRRLSSSWGNHWRCEEAMAPAPAALLRACKRL